ncbi:MAG: hypothetical protein KAS23_11175 [Anaerohalosphaera sp.]|nr:hypothetical protein [Anaerohalosphaera sp.]
MILNRVFAAGFVCLALMFGGCFNGNESNDGTWQTIGGCNSGGIKGKCVVTYFDADGSVYLTEQQHSFCGSSSEMMISCGEPEGDIVWKLAGTNFSTIAGADVKTEKTLCDKRIARVLMLGMLAGSDMLGGEVAEAADAVKIAGVWYEPTAVASYDGVQETAYRNVSTKRIDMVELVDESDQSRYTTYCYNYKFLKDINKTTPTKLEVSVKNRGQKRQRLLQVEYSKLSAL